MANTKITTNVIEDGAITSAKLDTNITISGNITGTLATAAQPNITSLGTLTSFRSTGIDDNADATAITIDSSENVMIGKTAANNTTAGTRIHPAGYASFTIANDYPIIANRLSSDGDIQRFRKDGADIGSIGVDGGSLVIGGGDVGIGFYQGANALVPINGETRALRDSAIDLGMSGAKYKDLYLSGTANVAKTRLTTNNTTYWDIRRDSSTGHFVISDDGLGDVVTIKQDSGNCGIGTTSPDAKLHLYGSSSLSEMYLGEDAATDKAGILKYTQGDGSGTGVITLSHYGNNSNTDSIAIKYGGNVGIGTTSPDCKLHTLESTNNSGSTGLANGGLQIENTNTTSGSWSQLHLRSVAYDAHLRLLNDGTLKIMTDGNTSAMTILDNGNVGIGETSPDNILHIKTTASGGPQIQMGDGTNYSFINFDGTSLQLSTQRDMVDGTWYNTSKSWGGITIKGEASGSLITFATANSNNTSPSEKMRIDGSGHVHIDGVYSTGGRSKMFEINPNAIALKSSTNLTNFQYHQEFANPNGTVGSISSNGSATAFNTSSDYRLKENVNYDFTALDRVAQLKPARFNFIADADKTVDGFLAHEVQDIVPEAVAGEKDAVREEEYEVTPAVLDDDGNVVTEAEMGTREVPEYQGIDQSKLVPLLTKAIQEQQTIIDDLKTRIETLEG